MEWNDEKQSRLDALRSAELAGTLDEAGKEELAVLIEAVETEERERLAPALSQIKVEQATLRQQAHESQDANEQLVILAAQQEQLLADTRRVLRDLQHRHMAIQEEYRRVTGEPLSVVR